MCWYVAQTPESNSATWKRLTQTIYVDYKSSFGHSVSIYFLLLIFFSSRRGVGIKKWEGEKGIGTQDSQVLRLQP